MDAHGFSRAERGWLLLGLLGFQLTDDIHDDPYRFRPIKRSRIIAAAERTDK
jgi:hypothetical protein